MSENITGANEAIVEESQQAAAVEESDVVTLADILGESEEEAAEQETVDQPQEDAPPAEQGDNGPTVAERQKTDREINAAFAKRLAAERRKQEKDPVYQLGKALASQYGGDAEKALAELTEKRAQELAQDPAALAKFVLGRQEQPKDPEPADLSKEQADIVLADIRSVIPNDTDIKAYIEADPEFIPNCAEFGARAAKKMADRAMSSAKSAQNIAAKLTQNSRLPQPIRPTNNARTKPVDFHAMSDKDFAAFEAKVKQARIEGKKIKLE